MAEELTPEEIADGMYKIVEDAAGKKKFKPGDLTKLGMQIYEERGCTKKMCKAAIRELVDSGRLVYTYFGGTFLELPHKEASAND